MPPLPAVERAYDAPADEPAENPIDFEALRRESPDVYAWLYVPNTNVNLPVLQRPGDDFFYLDHDRYGEPAVEGAVFSQMANATDFSDPVTVLYGHPAVRTGYFASVLAPDDPKANVRDGAQLDADDRIVQLSTCRSALTSDPVRYIVTAVLVGEKPAA